MGFEHPSPTIPGRLNPGLGTKDHVAGNNLDSVNSGGIRICEQSEDPTKGTKQAAMKQEYRKPRDATWEDSKAHLEGGSTAIAPTAETPLGFRAAHLRVLSAARRCCDGSAESEAKQEQAQRRRNRQSEVEAQLEQCEPGDERQEWGLKWSELCAGLTRTKATMNGTEAGSGTGPRESANRVQNRRKQIQRFRALWFLSTVHVIHTTNEVNQTAERI